MSENQLPEASPIPQSNDPSLPVPMAVTPAELPPSAPPPAAPPPTMSGRRPTGVTILAILSAVSGVVSLCCPGLLLAGSTVGALIPTGVTQVAGLVGIIFSCLLGIGPLLQLAFAYGAWNLRSWAWMLGVAAMGISVLGVLVNIIGSGGSLAATLFTNGIIPILILIYLLLPNTRKSFNV
jgi:hypothetical protein